MNVQTVIKQNAMKKQNVRTLMVVMTALAKKDMREMVKTVKVVILYSVE